MTIHNLFNLTRGIALSYSFCSSHKNTKEIKQGENYYLSALDQSNTLIVLGGLVHECAQIALQGFSLRQTQRACTFIPLAYIPFSFFAAAVKQGDYSHFRNKLVSGLNQLGFTEQTTRYIPETLGNRSITIINFCAEHTEDVANVAFIIHSCSLIYFGSYWFGAGLLTTLMYHEVEKCNYVPRKINLFLETYMSIIYATTSLLSNKGTLLSQVSAIMELTTFFSPANRFLAHKLDEVLHRPLTQGNTTSKFPDISLREYESPLVERKDMGYSEFLEIIQGNDKDYIINPAHCSKFSVNLDDLPEDDNFRDFVTMLNGINWETACEIIYKKVQNEEKFIGFLLKQTPETSRDDIKKNFEIHFNNYLKNQNKNKNDFLKEWTIEQMSCLVNHLTGTTLIKGKQRELNIAISDSKKILAYLKSDLSDLSDVEKSDLLLKLSVEAGDYCARGVSKVTQEIMSEIIIPSIEGKAGEIQTDRIKEYEIKIKTILENHRKELIEQIYGEMQSMQIIPKAISEDVHGFDIYRNMLCLGFYPMTRTERYEVRLDEIFQWSKIWRPIRKAQGEIPYRNNMYDQIKDNNLESLQYILLVIGKSENLSDKEKTNLESILSCSSDTIKINSDNYYPTINRLMLVMMGVLKKNPHLNSVEIPLQNPLPNLEDSDDEDNLL